MKERIKKIQERMEYDHKFREAITRVKPKRNFWGIAGIIIFFFLPEWVVSIWQDELISWAHLHAFTEPLELQRWLYGELEEMFMAGVSWVNLTIGTLLLFWIIGSK